MPKFDVTVRFPSPVQTVVTLDAPDAREAEIAALALVKSDPYHYSWEMHRPANPRYTASASPAKRGATDTVMTVTEETTMMNPVDGRRRKTLVSSTNSRAAEKIIRSAAASQFGRGKKDFAFEHGQWWATVKTRAGDDLYSVVDTYPGGIGFELIESHEY